MVNGCIVEFYDGFCLDVKNNMSTEEATENENYNVWGSMVEE